MAYGKMCKPTSGLMKCCVFVETIATDINIVYGPEFLARNSERKEENTERTKGTKKIRKRTKKLY
jgi:hypothetical protein